MYDEDLSNLEDWVRRLKIEYDIYFNGNRKRPPDDLRARVDMLTKKLSEATNMTYLQRFRYNTLVARYCLFRDLWRRTLQERETSGGKECEIEVDNQIAARTAPDLQPVDKIQVFIKDPNLEEEKVQLLYEALLRMRRKDSRNLPEISYPKFAQYIATQTEGIQHRYSCDRVAFTLARDNETIKFTAAAEKPR